MILPEKLRDLRISIDGQPQANLSKRSIYSLVYEPTARSWCPWPTRPSSPARTSSSKPKAQLRVRERLSSRKYIGSYEDVADALRLVCTEPAPALYRFFEQLTLAVLLRNGDAHLKNFAVLYDDHRVWLSPVYDQVTTVVYTYERPGGIETVDRTMALKLRRGTRSGDNSPARSYPNKKELAAFGRDVCGVQNPSPVVERIGDAMSATLAQPHSAVPPALREQLRAVWDEARSWQV